jgi:hypothetical protein
MRGHESDHHENSDQRRGAAGEPEPGAGTQERDQRAHGNKRRAGRRDRLWQRVEEAEPLSRDDAIWPQRRKRLEEERGRDNRRDRRSEPVEAHGAAGSGGDAPCVGQSPAGDRHFFRKPFDLR